MHIVCFQNNSIFYNSYFKCIEQRLFRIERITFSRYYVVNLEKCEIVFKLSASNCIRHNIIIFEKCEIVFKFLASHYSYHCELNCIIVLMFVVMQLLILIKLFEFSGKRTCSLNNLGCLDSSRNATLCERYSNGKMR